MKRITVLLIGTFLSINAFAAIITYETQTLNPSTFDNSNYEQSWLNNSNVITATNLSVFDGIYSGNNTFSHLEVMFNIGSIGFQFGLDAGFGEALYSDGNLTDTDTADLWWGYNWRDDAVVNVNLNFLAAGSHTLDLYWAEGCCNGFNSGRFTTDNETWQPLSVTNLESVAVPEPSIIGLFGLGLVGFGLARRKTHN